MIELPQSGSHDEPPVSRLVLLVFGVNLPCQNDIIEYLDVILSSFNRIENDVDNHHQHANHAEADHINFILLILFCPEECRDFLPDVAA